MRLVGGIQRSRSTTTKSAVQARPAAAQRGSATDEVLALQELAGNQAVMRLLVQREFQEKDGGQGQAQPVPIEGASASPDLSKTNDWGEIDGPVTSDVKPHVFVSGGRTGRAAVNWVGGAGGAGNQAVGSIDVVAPDYDGADPAGAGQSATAWIRDGTGTARVTRSYTGTLSGDNGGGYFFTARAMTRADRHEELHVQSSQAIHTTYITPLETRVAQRRGQAHALSQGATRADAITALQTAIRWNPAVTGFSTDDTTANTPMGTTDTTDMARADFVRDYGPRAVQGTNFDHYIDTPPGP
jgi:hypothetical protein